jgi:hypothetical protein
MLILSSPFESNKLNSLRASQGEREHARGNECYDADNKAGTSTTPWTHRLQMWYGKPSPTRRISVIHLRKPTRSSSDVCGSQFFTNVFIRNWMECAFRSGHARADVHSR